MASAEGLVLPRGPPQEDKKENSEHHRHHQTLNKQHHIPRRPWQQRYGYMYPRQGRGAAKLATLYGREQRTACCSGSTALKRCILEHVGNGGAFLRESQSRRVVATTFTRGCMLRASLVFSPCEPSRTPPASSGHRGPETPTPCPPPPACANPPRPSRAKNKSTKGGRKSPRKNEGPRGLVRCIASCKEDILWAAENAPCRPKACPLMSADQSKRG